MQNGFGELVECFQYRNHHKSHIPDVYVFYINRETGSWENAPILNSIIAW